MTIAISFRRLIAPVGVAAVLGLGLGFASAQEISESHLQAARKAISSIHATDQFDTFLPSTSRELKNELMRKDPNLEKVISDTVDEQALELVPRRAALEKEAARAYAKHFTEDELKQIADFYSSETGKKLLKDGPAAMADTMEAYDIWRQGIAQDLAVNVGKALNIKEAPAGDQKKAADAPASTETKPAPAKAKPAE